MAERKILGSWKEIAAYLGRNSRTCQRYERELGLPIHRLEDSARARVFAYSDEVDAWRDKKLDEDDGLGGPFRTFLKTKPFVLAASALLVAILGVLLFGHFSSRARQPGPRPSLAILPFSGGPGQEGPRSWAESLPRFLIQSLSRSKYFDVASEDRVTEALRSLHLEPYQDLSATDLANVAGKIHATHTVTGTLMRAGKGFVINLAVRRPGSEESYPSRFDCENEAALVKSIDRMAFQIKLDLGLTRSQATGDYDAAGMEVSTTSFEAFQLYSEGRRLHVGGDFLGSMRLMHRALELDPEFALALRSIAASLNSMESTEEAMEYFERALEASSKASAREQFWIRTDYFGLRAEYGKAIETCKEWEARFPEDTQALQVMGRQYIFSEDPEGAERALDLSLQKGDINPYTFYWSICARRMSGKLDQAERLYERALSVHPENSLIIQAGVENALARGSFDKALAEAQRHKTPGREVALAATVGDILLLKGDLAEAKSQYEKLPTEARVRNQALARLALAKGQYAGALELAAKAKDNLLVAYIKMRRGRIEEALTEAGAVLSASEGKDQWLRVQALHIQGMIETFLGDLPKARRSAARLGDSTDSGLEKKRQRHELFLTALIESASGSPEAARADFEAAISLFPPETDARVFRWQDMFIFFAAQDLEKAGDWNAAAGLYQKLLGLYRGRLGFPDLTALSHLALGRIAEARGDMANSRQHYQRFLGLWSDPDPGLPEVEEAKKRLAALLGGQEP
jgi:tetratricopeptide (TPR) repeat protein